MLRSLFGLVCLCALICSEARGGSRGRRKWRSPRGGGGGGERAPTPAPKVEKFEYATEMDADSFVEKVESVANYSLKPLYIPFVMFHVSSCQYCKHTLPEFEHAGAMVHKAKQDGNLNGLPAELKFFTFQCDKSPEHRRVCDQHPGAGLPMLKVFRDQHELTFPGERWAKKIAEWAVHVSRPALLNAQTKKDVDKYSEGGVVFLMKADAAEDKILLRAWNDLAYKHIEDTFFCVVPAGADADVASMFQPGQSVTVYGKGVEALPYDGTLTEKSLQKWVNLNQWKVVVPMTSENSLKLMQSGRIVVAYAYKFQRGMQLDDVDPKFKEKALEMRQSGKYIFASIDAYRRDNAGFLSRVFPAAAVPSMFVFVGNVTLKSDILYWESPTLRPSGLNYYALEDLMADNWARHDNGKISTAKAWGKWFYRFGTGTFTGFFLVIFCPFIVGLMLYCCLRELWASDDDIRPALEKVMRDKENKVASVNGKKKAVVKIAGKENAAEQKDGDENKEDADTNKEAPQKDANEKKDE